MKCRLSFPCDAGDPRRPDLQMRFVPAVPATADGINAYVKFSQIKKAGDYWPSGWALQLLNIQPRSALLLLRVAYHLGE